MTGKLSLATQKRLYALSGGRCYKCGTEVFTQNNKGKTILTGEIAHICGQTSKQLRYDPKLRLSDIDAESNLTVMCSSCHTEIDKDETTYTIDVLRKIKRVHESVSHGYSTAPTSVRDMMRNTIDATVYFAFVWPLTIEQATTFVFDTRSPTTEQLLRASLDRLLSAGYVTRLDDKFISTSRALLEYWKLMLAERAKDSAMSSYPVVTSLDGQILQSVFSSGWFRKYLKVSFDLLESYRDTDGILQFGDKFYVLNRLGRMLAILATVAICFSKKMSTANVAPQATYFIATIDFDKFVSQWTKTTLSSPKLDEYLKNEFDAAKKYLGSSVAYNTMMDYLRETKAFLCVPMDFCYNMSRIGRIEQSFLAAFGIS